MAYDGVTVSRDKELRTRVDELRERFHDRDQNATVVLHVRRGDWDKIDEDAFSDEFPRPIVSNRIDVMARHTAAALSVMPTFRCQPKSMGASDAAKKRADKRTQIVNHYMKNARRGLQMQIEADHLNTFGMSVTQVVPDFEEQMPIPTTRDSLGFYPVWDARGRTIEAAHVFRKRVVDLKAEYPEFLGEFTKFERATGHGSATTEWEVYQHDDGKNITLILPSCDNLVLHQMKNPVGRCLFVCTKRPTIDGKIRGAFDDLVYVQLARNAMQMLMLEAATKAVDAPLAVPLDVSEVPFGPDAVVRSANPEKIGRVNVSLPSEAFAATEHFKDELEAGAIVPQALSGVMDQSVVTGRGVQEMMAGYSQQVAMLQETLVGHHQRVAELCFAMDEALWPDVEKTISGYRNGASYNCMYTPSKDIAGDHTVDVSYGTSTGMDPNRHLVYLLQMQGAGMLSLESGMRELPGDINPEDELKRIQVEQGRSAIMSAVAGLAAAVPGMVAQGQDPSDALSKVAAFVDGLQKGTPLEELAVKVFPPPAPQPAAQDPMAALQQQMAGGPMGGGGAEAPALPGMPAERPDLNMMFAGLTAGGNPNLSATVSRSTAA